MNEKQSTLAINLDQLNRECERRQSMKITSPQQAKGFAIGPERPGAKQPDVGDTVFSVFGAGFLRVRPSTAPNGKPNGISIGCSWGAYGYAGGTMEMAEVLELRDLLTAWIDSQTVQPTAIATTAGV